MARSCISRRRIDDNETAESSRPHDNSDRLERLQHWEKLRSHDWADEDAALIASNKADEIPAQLPLRQQEREAYVAQQEGVASLLQKAFLRKRAQERADAKNRGFQSVDRRTR